MCASEIRRGAWRRRTGQAGWHGCERVGREWPVRSEASLSARLLQKIICRQQYRL
jgi:hypothetical protein